MTDTIDKSQQDFSALPTPAIPRNATDEAVPPDTFLILITSAASRFIDTLSRQPMLNTVLI